MSSSDSSSNNKRETLPDRVRGLSGTTSTDLAKTDGFSLYLAEIRRYPLLTLEEENRYAKAYFEDGDTAAGQKLVTGNLRLVVKLALEYRRAWANVMDLVQEGNIGLAEAVKRFDPYRGVRFSSFARYWIRALILQFILKNFRLISFANTRAGRKLFFRLEQERARLMQAFGEATPKQLAENLDVSEEDVAAATLLRKPTLSLAAPKGASDSDQRRTLGDTIADGGVDVEGDVVQATLMETVDAKMKAFAAQMTDEREKVIWSERLVSDEPVALAELGKRFGVSRERVRQVEARMKNRLRAFLTEELGESLVLDFTTED
ncbi:MAG: sigma-70 family RNA polymerase sigma factor [Myxococcota bacterium]|nr:sigma-70 family RNA polymerase sigma factor [Myxococcota bacterium]